MLAMMGESCCLQAQGGCSMQMVVYRCSGFGTQIYTNGIFKAAKTQSHATLSCHLLGHKDIGAVGKGVVSLRLSYRKINQRQSIDVTVGERYKHGGELLRTVGSTCWSDVESLDACLTVLYLAAKHIPKEATSLEDRQGGYKDLCKARESICSMAFPGVQCVSAVGGKVCFEHSGYLHAVLSA